MPLNHFYFQKKGSYLYVTNSVDEGFIAQIIVAREQRMVGFECHATWLDKLTALQRQQEKKGSSVKLNSPRYVIPEQLYWSYNPGSSAGLVVLNSFNWIFYTLGALHEFLSIYQDCHTFKDVGKVIINRGLYQVCFGMVWLGGISGMVSFEMVFWEGSAGPLSWMQVVLLGTYALPLVPELAKPTMRVSTWTLLISLVELMIAVRTFVDGKVLKPCQLIVYTVEHAASYLVRLLFLVSFMAYRSMDCATVVHGCNNGGVFRQDCHYLCLLPTVWHFRPRP